MSEGQRSNVSHRPKLTGLAICRAKMEIDTNLKQKLLVKGNGAWLSRHEILGIAEEEFIEFKEAVHSESQIRIAQELADIAVTCILGIAAINSKTLDW